MKPWFFSLILVIAAGPARPGWAVSLIGSGLNPALAMQFVAQAAAAPPSVPAPPPRTPGANPVDISIEQVGVGGFYRPGDPLTAIRVAVTCNADLKSNVYLQWRVPDSDGEIVSHERIVTLTPGRTTSLWLYAPLPPSFADDTVSVVQAFRANGERLGEELGALRFSPRDAAASPPIRVDLVRSMIGVVGRSSVGVEDYRSPLTGQVDNPPGANEETLTVAGIRPEDLPDRWGPLQSFEAIVWAADAVPQELRIDPALALREYVQRGGHLIIVLPQAGDSWGWGAVDNPAAHKSELDDLLPKAEPRRDQAVPLLEMIEVLGKSRRVPDTPTGKPVNINMDIRVFKQLALPPPEDDASAAEPKPAPPAPGPPFDAINLPWRPLIALKDGRVVAIQRTFGMGRITLLGIDVGYGQLRAAGLPQADVWWNRVLGRRSDTPRPGELAGMETEDRLYRSGRANVRIAGSGELVESGIRMSSVASKAVLLAVVLFIAYLVAAIPVSFVTLRRYRLLHYSWLVFVGTAGLFTMVAWGSVSLMRGTTVRVQHVTYLTHVAETSADGRTSERQLQHAVGWLSVFLPGYGRPRVSIEPYEQEPNLLLTWHPPNRANVERFPNVDRYRIDIADHPADYRVPGRATAKQFYANYLGPVAAAWGEMFSVDPADPVRVERDPLSDGDRLMGSISHNLPGELTNVSIIWVHNQRRTLRLFATNAKGDELPWGYPYQSGRMLNNGRFWRLGSAKDVKLVPGQRYNLQTLKSDGEAELEVNIRKLLHDPYKGQRDIGLLSENDRANFRLMLSLYHQLEPPKYLSTGPRDTSDPENVVIRRELGRELDLSPWFNRPCLIIIGELRGAPCPVPLRVDGEPVTETDPDSLTVVRWICPLDGDETQIVPRGTTNEREPEPPPTAPAPAPTTQPRRQRR